MGLDPLDLETQSVDGVHAVVGGAADGGGPGERRGPVRSRGAGQGDGSGVAGQDDGRRMVRRPVAGAADTAFVGASATTTDTTASGTGVKARAALPEGAAAGVAAVAAGEQQRKTAMSISAQPSATGRPMPLRRRSVRALAPVIAAIVDGV